MSVVDRAKTWLAHDPDPNTRAELVALLAGDPRELEERFSGPLTFGTAGLRGLIGAGESRMNRAVIRRTAAGLAAYLLAHVQDAAGRGVAIGYDGRVQSDVFARETAAVLCAAGLRVHLCDGTCPTPLLAFAVTDLGAAAGVMVTASHNPPRYNGFKVYAENGAQIIPPADPLIAQAIATAGHADEITAADLDAARRDGKLCTFGAELEQRYLDALAGLCPAEGPGRDLRIVYTPLHGVGNKLLRAALGRAGFGDVTTVPEQAEPDGRFPTVEFPNPEEPGAMDLALALAAERTAPLVIANDPDADRLAAVVRGPDGYVQLTGNEVGALLGYHALTHDQGEGALVLTTIVSSPLLGVMARELGADYDETLTGFKWIANAAMRRAAERGQRFLFGYEEALGYTLGTIVRDKDGIGAALVLCTIAAELHARGESLLDELTRIARRFGLFASGQRSVQFPGAAGQDDMRRIMARLRAAPPQAIAGHRVAAVTDCLAGTRATAGGAVEPIDLPRSDVLSFALEGGHRVIARPSGTEPKLKIYFDVREPLAAGEELSRAKQRAAQAIEHLAAEMLARIGT